MFREKRKIFVNINFAPKPAKWGNLKKIRDKITLVLQGNYFYILSLLTFVGIFIIQLTFKFFLEKETKNIENLRANIRDVQLQIKKLDQQIAIERNKFYKFYIPKLKEKVLYILFTRGYRRNFKIALSKFLTIANNINPYTGFVVYPNIYKIKTLKNIPMLSALNNKRVVVRSFNEIFKQKNPFMDPEILNIPVIYSPTVFIEESGVDTEFYKALQSIQSEDLKANLLLEYLLTKKDINSWNYYVPLTVIFPINLVIPDTKLYVRYLQLKRFCNYLIINKSYSEKIYMNNSIHLKMVIDGICVKNIF